MGEELEPAKPHSLSRPSPALRRLPALDAHRGLIMTLMAIDHASYFIARVHSLEIWGSPLPVYPDGFWFWTRWVTHPCAPGFFFLMGLAMALFAASRREAGWGENQIMGFFMVRGLLLILLQFTVENAAWALGDLSVEPGIAIMRGGPMPGGGTDSLIYVGVLWGLGGTMVFWAFVQRAGPWVIALVSTAAVIATQFAVPGPNRTGLLYPPLVRLLFIPGHTNAWEVLYSIVPWLGVTGLGLIFGLLLQKNERQALRMAGYVAPFLAILFIIIRTAGAFGNPGEIAKGWMGFLDAVKYPPSLAFLAITLAVNLLFVSAWRKSGSWFQSSWNPLLLFGRTALFFYLLHLWIYSLLGLLFRNGCGLGTMYAFWFIGLIILYPFCRLYYGFKSSKAPDSIWRFF